MRKYRALNIVLVVSLVLITFVVYIPSLYNGFVGWDDNTYIVYNPHICSINPTFLKWAFTTFHFSNWHPLTWVTYAIDYALWGLDPSGYHLANIVLHSINTLLVILLTTQLLYNNRETQSDGGAAIPDKRIITAAGLTGALFGLHPLHVESVAWVSERKDVLYAFFYLLSLLYYLRYAKGEPGIAAQKIPFLRTLHRHYGLALFFFLCALMAKPMAVTLPLVLIIFDWYPLKRLGRGTSGRVILEKFPFVLLSIGSSIITIYAQHLGGSMKSFIELPLLPRLLTGVKSLVAYLSNMFFPGNLSPFYPHPKSVMTANLFSLEYFIPFLIVIGITATSIIVLKKQPIFAAAWTYYIVTLLPVLGIVQVGGQAMADRYTYLPSLGPFLLIGIGIEKLVDDWSPRGLSEFARNALTLSVGLLFVASLSAMTIKQIPIWKDGETLWSRVIALYPEASISYHSRGVYYRDLGQYDKAIEDFSRWIAISPDDYIPYTNRAFTYVKLGRPEDALRDARKIVELDPRSSKTYSLRGKLYSMLGQYNEALKDYSKALQLTSDQAELYNSRGNIHVKVGLLGEAINDYTQAIKLSRVPRQEYYHNRSIAHKMLGHEKEALEDFARAGNNRTNP